MLFNRKDEGLDGKESILCAIFIVNLLGHIQIEIGAAVTGSEWKYIPMQRQELFLEDTLFHGMQWVVFEPNDESL